MSNKDKAVLTDEQIGSIRWALDSSGISDVDIAFARAIEAAVLASADNPSTAGAEVAATLAAKITCPGCYGMGSYIGQHDGYDDADCALCDGAGKIAAPVAQSTAGAAKGGITKEEDCIECGGSGEMFGGFCCEECNGSGKVAAPALNPSDKA